MTKGLGNDKLICLLYINYNEVSPAVLRFFYYYWGEKYPSFFLRTLLYRGLNRGSILIVTQSSPAYICEMERRILYPWFWPNFDSRNRT